MIAIANTRISVLRGESTDIYNDPVPGDTPVYENIPASLIERTQRVFTEDSLEPKIIRYTICRVGRGPEFRVGDRVRDERSGVIYAVDSFFVPQYPMYGQDIRLELKISQ